MNFNKMFENMDLSSMIPPQKEIEDYTIVCNKDLAEFERTVNKRLSAGYELYGNLLTPTQNEGSDLYYREMIKYKTSYGK